VTRLLPPQSNSTQAARLITKGLENTPPLESSESRKGLFFAGIILVLWMVSFLLLLSTDISQLNYGLITLAFIWQTILYTGLFITAHDAMHGVVCPGNPRVNHAIGTFAVTAYALFSYQDLLKKHWLHHKFPGTEHDPDFHDGECANFFLWYFQFMKHYWSWSRMLMLVLLVQGVHYFFHIPTSNLDLFWVFPSIASSIQLFYFGTFLTHREPEGGHTNPHRTRSTNFPIIWSFITCYHFGYHQEHHEYPHIPWWQLPQVYRLKNGNFT